MAFRSEWLRLPKWFAPPASMSREAAQRGCERLAAATSAVAALEFLLGGSQGGQGQFNDAGLMAPEAHPLLRPLVSERGMRTIQAVRLGGAAALLAPGGQRVRMVANACLAVTCVATTIVERHGTDGSDQATMLVSAVLTATRAVPDPVVIDAGMWFLTLQSALSYGCSGMPKVISRTWTSGRAIEGVLRTQVYGDERLWRLLHRHPKLAPALARSVISLELGLPLLLFRRRRLAGAYVLVSTGFHATNAAAMGLGRFLTAFAAFHPAVLYVSAPRQDNTDRDDRFPGLILAALGTGLLGLWVTAWSDARVRARTVPGERHLSTTAGGVLAYRTVGRSDGRAPLLVLEGGIGEPAEAWTRITRDLAEAHEVLVYSRAGYGTSRVGPGTMARDGEDDEEGMATQRADLRELLDHVAPARSVILVGHATGGHLCLTADPSVARRSVGMALIDPIDLTAPSARYDEGTPLQRDRTRRIAAATIHAGLGGLLVASPATKHAPTDLRRRLRALHRSPRTWDAMGDEARAQDDEQRSRTVASEPRVPVLVISSARWSAGGNNHDAFAERLAGAHPGGEHVRLVSAHGRGDLLRLDVAAQIASAVNTFAEKIQR